jgi:DNA-binding PadR family transcriptional regulator
MSKDTKGCGPKWGWASRDHASGGPPWMRGGPFAAWGKAMAGGRAGRMFGGGDLRLVLLALIADKPSHGYDLIRTIETKFGGAYAPSAGTVYPNLTMLEEEELIRGELEAGGKKSYAVTEKGQQFLTDNAEQVKALMARIEIMASVSAGPPLPASIMHAVHTLRHAIFARAGPWTTEEEVRVRGILERAARDIIGGPGKK